jgi:hypothetical protein
MINTEISQTVSSKSRIPPTVSGHAMMSNPVHQLASHGLRLRIGIGLLLGQDMPNRDQQFARDSDNRLLFADPLGQALKSSRGGSMPGPLWRLRGPRSAWRHYQW